jgi:superfamily II DNA/RNA helicase
MNYGSLINDNDIVTALAMQNISIPTQIQIDSYSNIISGRDVIGHSQTGSGKTLAYLVPLFELISPDSKELYSIILVPTYELAMQVSKQIQLLSANSGKNIRCVSLIGNGNISRQVEQMKSKPHIVVGTSGRVLELIKMKKVPAHTVKCLVIDEADRMMEKNNLQSMLDVRKCLYKNTQILFFSASMSTKAMETAKSIAGESVVVIEYSQKETIPETIKHLYVVALRREKTETLRSLCSSIKPNKCIIFINKKYDADEVYKKLLFHHYKIENLISDMDKTSRKNALERFRGLKSNYLISTDLGARGLHIDNVDTVINFNLPTQATDYLHRAGRCGRNNTQGVCVSIITENEKHNILNLSNSLGITFEEITLKNGKF